jgi:hypothetical protein
MAVKNALQRTDTVFLQIIGQVIDPSLKRGQAKSLDPNCLIREVLIPSDLHSLLFKNPVKPLQFIRTTGRRWRDH